MIILGSEVAPYKKFVATAFVSGYDGTCVWWENVSEEGFASLDITTLKASSKKCYKNSSGIKSKPFYLSIPDSKETGLQPGVKYKFRISAESSQGSIATSSIIVETLNQLEIGDIALEVNITSGFEAFSSLYTLSLSNEVPESSDFVQLTFSFGWKRLPTDDITLISQTRSTDENSPTSLETILPPGVESNNYNLIVTCDICTEHDICVRKEAIAQGTYLSSKNLVKLSCKIFFKLH